MSLDEIIQQRKSIRKYTNQEVDKQTIVEIIESARLAPSAVNFQPWKFYVCQSEESKQIVRANGSMPRNSILLPAAITMNRGNARATAKITSI